MQLNHAQRELTVKVVYYGPGLSGKTTNLQFIHERVRGEGRTHLTKLETQDDRTLFFDMLPVFFETRGGYKVKVKLFTVPGQVLHNATRRVVLCNADAVAFIADSRRTAGPENNAYWRNLRENMLENGLDPEGTPVVIQFNKLDLPDAKSAGELEETRRRGKEPVVGAVAVRGQGVLETLHLVLQLAYRRMDALHGISRNLGLSEEEFLKSVFTRLDCAGTGLAGRYAAPNARAEGGAA